MTITAKKRKFQQSVDADEVQITVKEFGEKYHCDSCSKDITYLLRIRCAVCTDFDLCVECFSHGAELNDHLKSHPYRVLVKKCLQPQSTSSQWTNGL